MEVAIREIYTLYYEKKDWVRPPVENVLLLRRGVEILMDITTFSLFLLPYTGDRNSIYSNRAVNKNAKETDTFMENRKET